MQLLHTTPKNDILRYCACTVFSCSSGGVVTRSESHLCIVSQSGPRFQTVGCMCVTVIAVITDLGTNMCHILQRFVI